MSKLFLKTCLWFGFLLSAGFAAAEGATKPGTTVSSPSKGKSSATYDNTLEKAQNLIEQGQAAEAYNLLSPLEFKYAGDVRFDYLIGIAALESGKADMATFALERVLSVSPEHAPARLDIARAYFQLGDLTRAETEFGIAMAQNSSDRIRKNIQKYLDEIESRKSSKRTAFSAYLEGSVGRDSNANNSTSETQIYIDSFSATAPLDPTNIKAGDTYFAGAAGGVVNFSLNAPIGLFAGAVMRKRNNVDLSSFDTFNLDLQAGLIYETRSDLLRVSLAGSQFDLGDSHNYDKIGIKGDWRHEIGPIDQVLAFAQATQYRYVDPLLQPNDFDQQLAGLGWTHMLDNSNSSLTGSVNFGTEESASTVATSANANGGRDDGAKTFYGVRLGMQKAILSGLTIFLHGGIQIGNYENRNFYFLRKRSDRFSDATLGVNWEWTKDWSFLPQLGYSRNDSNIALYGYDRMDISLTIRRDFR